jgi:hypothetical protein
MLLTPVSPYHQQQGSTKPSAAPASHSPRHLVPFASMGGECPRAKLHNCLQGLLASLPMTFGASMPSHSPYHFVPFASMWGNCIPPAGHTQPPTGATQYGCQGLMVPSPIASGAARPSLSLAHPFSHPPMNMEGSKGLMAPSTTMQEVIMPSVSLARQSMLAHLTTTASSTPSPPSRTGVGASWQNTMSPSSAGNSASG